MAQTQSHFPHFKRIITAKSIHLKKWIFKFTLSLLIFFITLNLLYPLFYEKTDEKKIIDKILLDPDNSLLHENLGGKYITFNIYAAKREYALAKKLDHFEQIKSYDTELSSEFSYWKNIYSSYPDYDYAKLKLAEISYFKGEYIKAKDLINSILKRNPYDPSGLKLRSKMD